MFNSDTWILNALQAAISNAKHRAEQLAKTDRIRSAIQATQPVKMGTEYSADLFVRLKDAPEARAYEYGSGIHATRGTPGTYPITARPPKKFLYFWWEREQVQFLGPIVAHPGVEASPAIIPAMEEELPRLRRDIQEKLKSDFYAYLRTVNQEINHA